MRSITPRILVILVAVIAAGFGTQQAAGGPAPGGLAASNKDHETVP